MKLGNKGRDHSGRPFPSSPRERIPIDTDHPIGCIVVATADPDLLRRWIDALTRVAESRPVDSVRELEDALRESQPMSVLLDLELVGGTRGICRIHQDYPRVRVMAVTANNSLEEAVESIKAGAHGHLPRTVDAPLIRRAVRLMSMDGLWAERRVLEASILQLVASNTCPTGIAPTPSCGSHMGLDALSEREVADLVSDGLCYKSIARRLDISENTVRNHLRNIYRKLGLNGMLQLGLLVWQSRADGATSHP